MNTSDPNLHLEGKETRWILRIYSRKTAVDLLSYYLIDKWKGK